jgi:hypothetical protein
MQRLACISILHVREELFGLLDACHGRLPPPFSPSCLPRASRLRWRLPPSHPTPPIPSRKRLVQRMGVRPAGVRQHKGPEDDIPIFASSQLLTSAMLLRMPLTTVAPWVAPHTCTSHALVFALHLRPQPHPPEANERK